MNNLNKTIQWAETILAQNKNKFPKLAELLKKLKENREKKKPVNKLVTKIRAEMEKILLNNTTN